jgi:hypothetical protein
MGFFEQVMIRVVAAVITIVLILIVMHFIDRCRGMYGPSNPNPQPPIVTDPNNTFIDLSIPGTGDFSFNSVMF